jgi:hypothetical protein
MQIAFSFLFAGEDWHFQAEERGALRAAQSEMVKVDAACRVSVLFRPGMLGLESGWSDSFTGVDLEMFFKGGFSS